MALCRLITFSKLPMLNVLLLLGARSRADRTSLLFYRHNELDIEVERGRGSRYNLQGRDKKRDSGGVRRGQKTQAEVRS